MRIENIVGKPFPALEDRDQMGKDAPLQAVKDIVAAVQKKGDEALFAYTREFDGYPLSKDNICVTKEEIQAAYKQVEPALVQTLKKAVQNLIAYHNKQKRSSWFDPQPNSTLGQLIRPLQRVGVYVPGGTAAYPSTVLMNTVPARVAGVQEVVMVTPAKKETDIPPLTLVAADIAGVDSIYRVGGAQAVTALAFGTDSVPKVDKIVGPGNIFVALAKREVFGYVGIDSIAGPSEVVVVADKTANPRYVAADLLSQAEHDPMASAVCITDDEALAMAVSKEVQRQLALLERGSIARQSVENHGCVYVVEDIRRAIAFSNVIAPEHLELCVEDAMSRLGEVQNAGAVFVGSFTPEPVGDYWAGSNHVLPTSGTARFFSGLGVDDFLKKSSVVYYTKDKLRESSEDIQRFATAEGLTAHARAVGIRFEEEV